MHESHRTKSLLSISCSSPEGILKSLYLILGFCALWLIYSIGKILSPFKKIAVSIAILALLNPGFALFQNQSNYELPTLCFLMGILLYGYLYLNKGLKPFEKIPLQKINSLADLLYVGMNHRNEVIGRILMT